MNPLSPPAARVFEVRYGPEKPAFDERWPNNLKLTGSGRVEVSGEALRFSDTRNAAPENLRTIAFADVANAGFAEHESLIAVRTRKGDREVHLWMASADEARALFELLPRVTTPEFVERREQHRKFHENLDAIAPRAPVTPTIIGLNVLVFAVMLAAGAGLMALNTTVHMRFGANFGPLTWGGEPWRLIASAFIHFGLIHLAFNMYALYNGGILTEQLFGSVRFAVIYLLAALAGSVISSWWVPVRVSAGASGAVFGVYGALLAFMARRPNDIPRDLLKSVRSGAISLCVYSLALGAISPYVDNAAHIGGLLGGAVAGFVLARPFEPAARSRPRPLQILWAVLAVGLGLGWFALSLLRPSTPAAEQLAVERAISNFEVIDTRLAMHQREMFSSSENERVDRLELARRLRSEVLAPLHDAAQPLVDPRLRGPTGTRQAVLLAAKRDYVQGREKALDLRALALETGLTVDADAAAKAEEDMVAYALRYQRAASSGN